MVEQYTPREPQKDKPKEADKAPKALSKAPDSSDKEALGKGKEALEKGREIQTLRTKIGMLQVERSSLEKIIGDQKDSIEKYDITPEIKEAFLRADLAVTEAIVDSQALLIKELGKESPDSLAPEAEEAELSLEEQMKRMDEVMRKQSETIDNEYKDIDPKGEGPEFLRKKAAMLRADVRMLRGLIAAQKGIIEVAEASSAQVEEKGE